MQKIKSKVRHQAPTKLPLCAITTARQRRAERIRVLAAIAALFPDSQDTDGRARGILSVAAISARAEVSKKAVTRALKYWRSWRALWLYWQGHRMWEIRFERPFIESILNTASAMELMHLHALLTAHRWQREAAMPWRRVPKTISAGPSQATESVGASGAS